MKQYKIKLNNDPLNKGFSEASRVCDAAIMLGYKTCILHLSDANLVIASVDEFKLFEDKLSDLTEISEDDFISMVATPRLYLDPNNNYGECYAVVPQEHWVKVPDSAEQLTKQGENLIFWNGNFQTIDMEHTEWADMGYGANTYLSAINGSKMVWSVAKHPEPLPFVDDAAVDNVNHPNHYAASTIECIDAMEAMLTPEQFIGYLRGNIFKYQWRYENKNGLEDLNKSQWYLEKLMEKLIEKEA